jgi:hypothetical protein
MSNSALNVYRCGARAIREEVEGWKQDHKKAIECFNLEDFLGTCVRVAEGLALMDEQYRARVFSGSEKFDQEHHNLFMETYKFLTEAFQETLGTIEAFEKRFGTVKNAKEFRSHLEEMKGILTPDNEFFGGGGLIPLRDAAIDSHLGGGTIECGSWK